MDSDYTCKIHTKREGGASTGSFKVTQNRRRQPNSKAKAFATQPTLKLPSRSSVDASTIATTAQFST
jgi:hypothetical protein